MPQPAATASYCSGGGAFCMAWSTNVAAGMAFFTLSTTAIGYVSVGFSDTYNAMSPADVYAAWSDPSTGAGMLTYRRNANGHDMPQLRSLPSGAQVLSAATANGKLTVSFAVPVPAANSAAGTMRRRLLSNTAPAAPSGTLPVNVIWSTSAFAPIMADGNLAQHGDTEGVDFGALAVDLQCATSGGTCVLATGDLPAFNMLHKIVLAGFFATLGLGILARGVRTASFVAEDYAQQSAAKLLPSEVLGPQLASWGLPELVLITGYAITLGVYLQQAVTMYPTSRGRAIGTALAPALGTALLPVSRRSVINAMLGVSYERAIMFHQAAMQAFLVIVVAHAAVNVVDSGMHILTDSKENITGSGSVYGTVAAVFFAAMAVLASPAVRRRWWKLFKASHLIGFPVALILACVHANMVISYIVPPLVLYVVDRGVSYLRCATLMDAKMTLLPPGNIVRIRPDFRLKNIRVKPDQFAWISVPELGATEWHPYTMVTEWLNPNEVSFLISATPANPTAFGARLANLLTGCPGGERSVRVRVDAPYGVLPVNLSNYVSVVLIAGGVGITPMPRIARACMDVQQAAKDRMRRVTLVWSARDADAFTSWLPSWLSALEGNPLFSVHLHDTSASGSRTASRTMPTRRIDSASDLIENGNGVDLEMHDMKFDGGAPTKHAGAVQMGRPDVAGYIDAALEGARECGDAPNRVLVMCCGPTELIAAAQAAAASRGCHFYSQTFKL